MITDFEFDASTPDMECLREAAELAEQLQAPLLVNVGAAFFGKKDAVEASRIPLLRSHLESA
ncbi:MAG: type VI secretion system contractile sheath large subunit, partial [Acidobacteriota bacterium]